MSRRFYLILMLPALLVVLAACATMNTTSDGRDKQLMLKGYDPVAYVTERRPVPGDPAITATHEGVTYRFSTASHRESFSKNPERYVPQYGGYCTNGAVYAIKSGGDPRVFKIVDDRLFIFGAQGALDFWAMDERRNIELGDHYWQTEMKDASAVLQSAKRWVFKVPHYKTNRKLSAELAARNKGAGVK